LAPLSLSFNSVPEKFKSYLGIQHGTFLLRKKKIVLLYVRRVVSIRSIFRKKITPLTLPNNLPPLPHSHTKKMAAIYNHTVTIVSQKYQELCLISETILIGFLHFRETTR
jgi:hypothetical protein